MSTVSTSQLSCGPSSHTQRDGGSYQTRDMKMTMAGKNNSTHNDGQVDPTTGLQMPNQQNYLLLARDEDEFEIHGRLIGFASSERDIHSHGPNHDFVPPGTRCAACRWFEVRIFTVKYELTDDCSCEPDGDEHDMLCGAAAPRGQYLVLTYGRTVVPGETNKRRAEWVNSPYEIVELLTQHGTSGAFLPKTSARAIAQAAAFDHGIRDAYLNRAVV